MMARELAYPQRTVVVATLLITSVEPMEELEVVGLQFGGREQML